MLFALYKTIWKTLWFYLVVLRKIRHPVSESAVCDTKIDDVKVIVVPTLWDNYSYIMISGNDAIVIDPSEYGPIRTELQKRNLELKSIVITHEHIDHVLAVQKLRRKYRAPLYIPRGAGIPGKSREIVGGDKLTIGDCVIEAIFVPGHFSFPYPVESLNRNIAWYCEKAGIAFTGDTLFSCGYGYTAPGHEAAMFESLKLLRALPDDTLLFFGHEYSLRLTASAAEFDQENAAAQERLIRVRRLLENHEPTVPTALKLEKSINPWLRWDDEKLLKALGIIGALNYNGFLAMREKKEGR